jgi:hypothetical protein
MQDANEIGWLLGQITIVVLAVWLVLKILFFRRPSPRASRGSHVGDAVLMLVIAALWAGLCFLFWMGAAFAGASAGVTWGILAVGAGVGLVLLWGAVRRLWQAFGDSGHTASDPQVNPPAKSAGSEIVQPPESNE